MHLPPKILFAALGTRTSGAGHVMRCITYAQELHKLGYDISFFGKVSISWVKDYLRENTFLSEPKDDDVFNLVIVDSYDRSFMEGVLHNFRHSSSVQILDSFSPILSVEKYIWLDTSEPRILNSSVSKLLAYGPQFMAVRQHALINQFHQRAKRVALLLGGAPNDQQLEICLASIASNSYREINFHVFVNKALSLRELPNVNFHNLGLEMNSIVDVCDTIITACGTSIWTFLANKRCVGAICLVENQRSNYTFVTQRKLAISVGDLTKHSQLQLDSVEQLFFDTKLRYDLMTNPHNNLDSFGARRFADRIHSYIATL
jgi:spore coat polysaccharide biosynthesis predicted glycosyltransferase SpsG